MWTKNITTEQECLLFSIWMDPEKIISHLFNIRYIKYKVLWWPKNTWNENWWSQQSKIHFIDINKHNTARLTGFCIRVRMSGCVFLMIFPFFLPIVFTKAWGRVYFIEMFGHSCSGPILIENYTKDNGALALGSKWKFE